MAKFTSAFPFTGGLGDVSGYKRHDSPHTHLRYKGGADKERIKTGPEFARTRENNSEFAGAGKAVKELRTSMSALIHCGDSLCPSRMVKLCRAFQKYDNIYPAGQAPVKFSKYGHLLDGF